MGLATVNWLVSGSRDSTIYKSAEIPN